LPIKAKPEIALAQIRQARQRGISEGVVLADAGYGTDSGFRTELTQLELRYVVGIQSTLLAGLVQQSDCPTLVFVNELLVRGNLLAAARDIGQRLRV
jgi:SRSO17 transposase